MTKTIPEIPAYVLPPNTTPSNSQNPGDISAAVTKQTGKIMLGMHIIATSADSDQTWQMTVGPSGHVMLPDGNIINQATLHGTTSSSAPRSLDSRPHYPAPLRRPSPFTSRVLCRFPEITA